VPIRARASAGPPQGQLADSSVSAALGRVAPAGIIAGARATKSSISVFLRPWSKTTQTPPPPRLAEDGKVTDRAKYMATAASPAEPPAVRISRPIRAARGSSAATAP
jgi:hypothetical protein